MTNLEKEKLIEINKIKQEQKLWAGVYKKAFHFYSGQKFADDSAKSDAEKAVVSFRNYFD